uniref:Uncharacterized protein n=1 Tax=Auxenochlorella protothecoides TaxID=3075 RepID=A0A1D1ZPT2_AUXPR
MWAQGLASLPAGTCPGPQVRSWKGPTRGPRPVTVRAAVPESSGHEDAPKEEDHICVPAPALITNRRVLLMASSFAGVYSQRQSAHATEGGCWGELRCALVPLAPAGAEPPPRVLLPSPSQAPWGAWSALARASRPATCAEGRACGVR